MTVTTSYSHAREDLASLRETAYLLRFHENAVRLRSALTRAHRGRNKAIDRTTLRREVGVAP